MVSSRSKTAAEAAANKRTTRSSVASGVAPNVQDISKPEQEDNKKAVQKNVASKPPVSSASTASKSTNRSRKKGGGTYCLCKGEDNGTPMIKCEGGCQNWYHFRCVDLDEDDAGEIEQYICPECEVKTGRKTVMDFEGADAFVEPPPVVPAAPPDAKKTRRRIPVEEIDVVDSPEESDGAGSEDDYIAEPSNRKSKTSKRPARQATVSSDETVTDVDDDESEGGRRRRPSKSGRLKRLNKVSASPAPELSFKRRSSSAQHPAPKRSKTAESPHDDAIRKYCLSKLEEIICPMFEEYREAQSRSQTEGQVKEEGGDDAKESITSSVEDDKNELVQKVKSFVNELERCMMDTYAEPDKTGKPSAGGKYKERFRMLQFNLPKPDRVALRKGIASGRITPAQLNVMSSTDLANEQTKHEIEQAEKEALEHSILQKITAPRAKITHKGLETIEDMSGQRAADAAREEEERRMEMEKREREKVARTRTLSISHRQGSPTSAMEQSPSSSTLPKQSPTVDTSGSQQSWGAPPPVPIQMQQAVPPVSPATGRPTVRPLFMPSVANELATSEQGLSLDDIINMDDDVPMKDASPSNPQQRMTVQVSEAGPSSSPITVTPSGPSPFAPSKPAASPQRSSFDLSALWTGSKKDDGPNISGDDIAADRSATSPADDNPAIGDAPEGQEEAMELDSGDDDNERALDAIFEQSASAAHTNENLSPQSMSIVESLPEVWTGNITMPKENFEILSIDVCCKQIGGRNLEPLSGYWQTLFPATQARIDGRVPTAQSAQYLVSVRMNSSKELIVVIFTPRSEEAISKFNELIDFLMRKDRHALVFPWGTQPKPQAPGRELYLIPLLKNQPIPEFMELMDDHYLPKERTANMLLGAFVLNKGKLMATTPLPGAVGPAPTPTPFPSILSAPQSIPSIPPGPVPTSQPSVTPSTQAKIDQAALAVEIASLTPEQVSLMVQHLSQSRSFPLPTSVEAPTYAPATGSTPPPAPSYPAPGMPPFPPQFLPASQQQAQPLPGHYSPSQQFSPPHSQSQYGEHYFDDRDDRNRDFGRDGYGGRRAGWRGSERGRRGKRGRKPFHDDRGPRPTTADKGWGDRSQGGPPR